MLTLDAADPVIAATVAGRPLRLRVDPAQWDAIELNGAVADTMDLPWLKGRELDIGRVTLPGRTAQTMLQIGANRLAVLVATHGRIATDDADGVIGPDQLPYAAIRWHRADAPPPTGTITLPLMLDTALGLVATDPELPVPIHLRFSLARPRSEATAAAGSLLVRRYGGAFGGAVAPFPVMLGVTRPARPLMFTQAPRMAGFRFPRLTVRISDFRGDNPLPTEAAQAGEIVVAPREAPQPAQSWVTIAADYLARCADVTYTARPRRIALDCAFDAP